MKMRMIRCRVFLRSKKYAGLTLVADALRAGLAADPRRLLALYCNHMHNYHVTLLHLIIGDVGRFKEKSCDRRLISFGIMEVLECDSAERSNI
ncbi:hypothetical protein V6N13_039792 [Hibiscus sabdariffa]|uniref:Uncharacterized protein n=1 Tax=Hibiscus sabdariffa TaxID=183260 RepID=A0ABR2SUF1_9ROSI